MKYFILSYLLCVCPIAWGAYSDIVSFFDSVNTSTTFPIQNQDLDSLESAFGIRKQTSTGNYDWHRGLDFDGNLNSDLIYAPVDGYFYDYRQTTSGGYITILYHKFSDFNGGAVSSINYDPDNDAGTVNNHTRFYTWYLHLFDDGVNGNGVGSFDEYVSTYAKDDPISQGTPIGILGDSGSPGEGLSYGPHLHFELRFGTTSSLEYQLGNPVTQYGFDPHMNPMFLFDVDTHGSVSPNNYAQSMSLQSPISNGQDVRVDYEINNDEAAMLNRLSFAVIDTTDDSVQESHVLDFNTREGFDPTSTANLDTADTGLPYIEPEPFGDTATVYETTLVIPASFVDGYFGGDYELKITTTDIWGNEEIVNLELVPEPESVAFCFGLVVLFVIGIKRMGRDQTTGS